MQKFGTLTIALVDDYIPLRNFVRDYLSQEGFTVVCEADNGLDFLKYLVQAKTPPDLCLLDLIMPIMSGYETLQRLQTYYPQIRVLAYSSCEHQDEINRVLQSGAHGYFSKGNSPDDLSKALLKLISAAPVEPFFDLLFPVSL